MSAIHSSFPFMLRKRDEAYEFTNQCPFGEITLHAFPMIHVENRSAFAHYVQSIEQNQVSYCLDVQPINGHQSKRFLKDLIRESTCTSLQQQLTYLKKESLAERVILFVLDIKDFRGRYANKEEIEQGEIALATMLQKAEPNGASLRKKFHQIIRENHIQFFLQEGKLKHDVLAKCSSEQRAYYEENERGKEQLCQLCEIIMNFFKMGFAVEFASGVLHPENYFLSTTKIETSLSSEEITLEKTHYISLKTLYPEFYRRLYSEEEEYFRAINQAFNTEYKYDASTQTTVITINQ